MRFPILFFLLSLCIFLFSACRTPDKILEKAGVQNSECVDAILLLQKNIYPLEDNEFYGYKFESEKVKEQKKEFVEVGESVTRTFDRNRDCLANLNKSDIIELFGAPAKQPKYNTAKEFRYFFSFSKYCPCEDCAGQMRYGECSLLRIEFNEKNFVTDIDFLAFSTGWD